MKISLKGRVFIARHEAVCLVAYDDGTGVPTIGIGHTARAGAPVVQYGMTITLPRAFEIFERDLRRFEKAVDDALQREVPQHVFDALVSFCFNVGADNFRRSSVLRYVNQSRPVPEAAMRLALWNKAGGRVLPGLVERRADERRLMTSGDYGDLTSLLVYRRIDRRRRPAEAVRMSTAAFLRPPPASAPGRPLSDEDSDPTERTRLASIVGTLFAVVAAGLLAILAQGD